MLNKKPNNKMLFGFSLLLFFLIYNASLPDKGHTAEILLCPAVDKLNFGQIGKYARIAILSFMSSVPTLT